jgi:hypothetical protein
MKIFKLSTIAFAIAAACLATSTAKADLIGTSVTGSLQFTGSATNFFDPANGFVNGLLGTYPGGSLNAAGTTVTISGTATEFGFMDTINTDSADFTGTQLTVTDVTRVGSNSATYTFTDTAFNSLSLVSNSFPAGLTYSLSGDTITVNTPLFSSTAGTFQAVFNVNSGSTVPDTGSTLGLLSLSVVALLGATRLRFLQLAA